MSSGSAASSTWETGWWPPRFRRIMKKAAPNAIRPIAPIPTPTPMPIFAPLDSPPLAPEVEALGASDVVELV